MGDASSELRQMATELWGRAEADLRTVETLIVAGSSDVEIIGFHAQQAAEKLIKSLLLLRGDGFIRTHDLLLLYERMSGYVWQGALPLPEDLARLNVFAVVLRYQPLPDDAVDVEAVWVREMLKRVVDWAVLERRHLLGGDVR